MEKFNVRHEDAEAALKEVGATLRDKMPEGFGFALLVFNFGPGGGMFYTSNAQRDDMLAAMKEFIANAEADK